ncbi:MAG: hypothetical protein QMD46_08395 [Methanomicrobiales archaeon]|nr:hypothetical protein [Methanomicrobiales archaeon]MDI6876266.1 hypothetical protein [Methanomicrobiales archaeon]
MVSIASGEPLTGHLHIAYPILRRRIRQYLAASRGRCRIGITGDLRETARDCDGRYREIALLYRTRSPGYIREIERRLRDQFTDLCDTSPARSGRSDGQPPYYCYVAWNPKRG